MRTFLALVGLVFATTAQAQPLLLTPSPETPTAFTRSATHTPLRAGLTAAAAGRVSGDGFVLDGTAGVLAPGRIGTDSYVAGGGFWQAARPATAFNLALPPALSEPADGAEDVPLAVRLAWGELPGAATYDVQVHTDPAFPPPIPGQAAGLTATAVTVEGLAPGITYFWRVRGVNAAGAGPFAEPFRFTTAVSTAAEEAALPERFDLRPNYPNPFNPSTTIAFDLPSAAAVRLIVFDAYGREVAVLADGVRPAGRHVVRFEAGGLASGLYLYRLDAGAFRMTRKMLLVK